MRLSLGCNNTEEDIDRALEMIPAAVAASANRGVAASQRETGGAHMNIAANSRRLTAVAMSGGVDSSAVAAMLQEAGAPIVGLTMQLWNQRRLPQISRRRARRPALLLARRRVRRAARGRALGLSALRRQFRAQFEDTVMRPFVEDYLAGRTPIPCALCNNHVKFDQLLVTARQIGADASPPAITRASASMNRRSRYELLRAVDLHQGPVLFSLWLDAGADVAHALSRSAS